MPVFILFLVICTYMCNTRTPTEVLFRNHTYIDASRSIYKNICGKKRGTYALKKPEISQPIRNPKFIEEASLLSLSMAAWIQT